MDVINVVREWVGGREVNINETPSRRDGRHDRELDFGAEVVEVDVRFYVVLAGSRHAMDVMAALGSDGHGRLCELRLLATKTHPIVPDRRVPNERDVVGDILHHLVSAIATEHDGRMDDSPWYRAILDAPLQGTPYLHDEV
ncbi:hypothetical protein CBR_g992 [Chara braunii]|uniref:Uncharacterized protein n=1 Tax=Chara braunii TaxID=69332 RepID=A0A388KD48_CHABU|nr:hypothetical protein CBR_g992 [Chara braunii]|eukprot:GBG67873.1 hypothetical protein CBR_g992 [Chara braunii]